MRINAPSSHTYQGQWLTQLVCVHVPIPPEASMDLSYDSGAGTCGAVFLPLGMAT